MNIAETSYQKSYSVLRNARSSDVAAEPFPHLVIRDALPAELAGALTQGFPTELFDASANNERSNIDCSNAIQRNDISEHWVNFVRYHTSQAFLDEFLAVFGPHISALYPDLYPSTEELKKLKAGMRKVDGFGQCDVIVDAQISVNSPVKHMSAVRKVHIDKPNKLFVGLFYLRQPGDTSTGGSLQICGWKSEYGSKEKLRFYTESLPTEHFELVKEIPYENNVCVLFLNSMNSLHGVTPRSVTENFRTFANLVGEVNHTLFRKESRVEKWRKKIKGLSSKYLSK